MHSPFRLDPALPVTAVKTYSIRSPIDTHYVAASCADVDCEAQRHGWHTFIDESTAQGRRQAHYIRATSGRHFTEHRNEQGVTVFQFAPGEECFIAHQRRVDRPEIFVVHGGDHRGNPRGEVRVHDRPEHWVEDFDEHQQALIKAQE